MIDQQKMKNQIMFAYEPIKGGIKCGCYVQSGELLAQYPNKLILVPLRSSEYSVEIVNAVANITLTQLYVNPTDAFLEVGYSFPINPNACVYRFAAEFGKTRVEGVVKEKEEAKREYTEAVAQGKRAAIGALDENSKDILHLKVGNIGPREEVRVELVFMQELSLANNTFYQLRLFGTISPRYLSHLSQEALLEGFRNPTAKATGAFYWNFSISLRTSRKVVFFDSNSHDVTLVSQNEQQNALELAMEKAAVPNKDFVFSYTTEDFQLPSYVFGRTDCSSSAMLSFIPKFCSLNLDDAYKASVAGNAVETEIEQAKGEYVFLLDRSGSMGGKRIEKAKEALILFIKSLPEDTFFNVVSFGDASRSLFPKSVRYADTEVEKAVKAVRTMGADMGGTEVYGPLHTLLTSATIPGYPKQVFLLTDGGVSNTEGVIKMVAANTKFARVHTIGIGNGASEALIVGCAKSGKGHHVFISDADNPSEKIIQLLTDSLSPVISGMKLGYDSAVVASIVPNPDALPYVLKGEVVNFYIAFKGQLAQPTTLAFSYEDSANKLPFASELQVDPAAMNESFVDRMGHFRRIRLLEEALSNNTEVAELMFAAKVVDLKAEIIRESVRHQILSQFTAFLCVEKELVDGRYEEVKGKGQISVQVQNPLPQQFSIHQINLPNFSLMPPPSYSMCQQSYNFGSPPISNVSIPPSNIFYSQPQGNSSNKRNYNNLFGLSSHNISKPQFQSPIPPPQSSNFASFFSNPPPPPPMCSPVDLKFHSKFSLNNPPGAQGIGNPFGNIPQNNISIPPPPPSINYLSNPITQRKSLFGGLSLKKPAQYQDNKGSSLFGILKNNRSSKSKMQEQLQQSIQNPQGIDFQKGVRDQQSDEIAFDSHMDMELQQLSQVSVVIPVIEKKKCVLKSNYKIEDVIVLQSSDGSWKDLSLIGHLFGKQVQQRVAKGPKLIAVITLLVVKWIQKNHPSKQYSLLTKKGISFVKKETDFEALSAAYADIIQ